MTVVIAILLALSAISATPETESPKFAVEVMLDCDPVITADFVGCEVAPGYSEDETGYAGWSHGEPVTGP